MVAKLKTSFLKSSFQLFCSKTLFGPQDQTTTGRLDTDAASSRIKPASTQFGSSPNLTLATLSPHTDDAKTATKDEPQNSKHVNRSASASGRVIEAENGLTSNQKDSPGTVKTSQEMPQKPVKKIPKYLAKSKNQANEQKNHDMGHSNGDVPKKQRSKSSNCLMNREEVYESSKTGSKCLDVNNNIEMEFYRHSYPSQITESLSTEKLSNQDEDKKENNHNNQNNTNQIQQKLDDTTDQDSTKDDNQELKSNAHSTSDNNAATGLYKNSQSIESLKQAKKMQLLNRMNSASNGISNSENNKQLFPGQMNLRGEATNLKFKNTPSSKKPIIFNYKNSLITSYNRPSGDPSSILLTKQQKFAKQKSNSNPGTKLGKKAVRFADSLGLELESIITVQQSELDTRRRHLVRTNQPINNNQYITQSNLLFHKNQFIQANAGFSNSAPKYNFAKAYNPTIISNGPNNTNITHFHSGNILRQQDHEARKFLDNNRNQFEDGNNGPSLYDDIVNKIAFGTDNQFRHKTNHNYENDLFNGYGSQQGQQGRPYLSNSDKHLSDHMRINGGNQLVPNIPYHMVGQSQQAASIDALNRHMYRNNLNSVGRHEVGRSKNSNGNIGLSHVPNNITITTRINNGKLESEV